MEDRLLSPTFVLVWVANLMQTWAFFMFVHLPGHLSDLGADAVQIGVVVGTASFASILLRPAVGSAMDRRGRRPVILAGNVVNVAAVALYLWVDSLGPAIYAVRALHGIGEATLFASLSTYAADVIPAARRTQGLALYGVSGLLPLALGGLLGDLLLSIGDYDLIFLAATGFAAASLAACLPLPEPPVEGGGPRVSTPILTTFTSRRLRPLWWATFVFAGALASYFTFLKVYVDEIGAGSVGAFFASYAVVAILLRIVGGRVPARFGEERVLHPALGTLAAGFLLLAVAPSAAGIVAAGALCGAGHAFAFPILYSLVVTRARPTERGAALAIFTGLFDGGILAGGPMLGLVVAAGGYAVMFGTAAVWLVAGAIVFAAWDRAAA